MPPGIRSTAQKLRVALVGIIESNPLLQMGASRCQFSEVEQGRPQLLVGLLQEHRVLQTLGEGETLLCQLTRHLETRRDRCNRHRPAITEKRCGLSPISWQRAYARA